LFDESGLDQSFCGHAFEFTVELLRGGHPEVGHRGIEAFGQVVPGGFALEKRGEHRVA
jgi:hypothetical protein